MRITTFKLPLGLCAAGLLAASRARACRQDAGRDQGTRPGGVRRQHRPAGFLAADSQGNWTGLDVDVCRADRGGRARRREQGQVRAAQRAQRFTALQSGEIDMLSRNTTWTLTRDASLGLHFTGTTYYDGQGFMVPKKSQDQERQAAEGRNRLRAVRHDDREEPDRLLQGQQPEHQAGRVREAGSRRTTPTSPAAARPTRPTPRAWPRCATRRPRNPKTT